MFADTNHFNIGAVMELGIRLIGNGQAPVQKYWKELLEQIQVGELDPTLMVSHRIDLEDIAKAYRILDAKEDGMMKVFIQTKFSGPPAKGSPTLKRL
jgi:threonine dehydrogenase-like Zn-dependent dehydrogenase